MTPDGQMEIWNIRLELLVRIAVQNMVLMVAALAFILLGAEAVVDERKSWPLAVLYGVASFSLILQWCHNGVRTMQIKKFILIAEGEKTDTWERWLPINRPQSFLGSRWVVSTKGVFLGLQAAAGIGAISNSDLELGWALVWGVLFLGSIWFLFTNPKESLS